MPELTQTSRPSLKYMMDRLTVKNLLKWSTIVVLVLIVVIIIWSLVDELKSIGEFEREMKKHTDEQLVKEAHDDMRSWKVTTWATYTLHFSYILLAIYATITEKYSLLLAFATVDLVLNIIYIFDFEGVLDFLFDFSVTVMCFITAIYFKFQQNIPWNPF